jgi:hypothetical protein
MGPGLVVLLGVEMEHGLVVMLEVEWVEEWG